MDTQRLIRTLGDLSAEFRNLSDPDMGVFLWMNLFEDEVGEHGVPVPLESWLDEKQTDYQCLWWGTGWGRDLWGMCLTHPTASSVDGAHAFDRILREIEPLADDAVYLCATAGFDRIPGVGRLAPSNRSMARPESLSSLSPFSVVLSPAVVWLRLVYDVAWSKPAGWRIRAYKEHPAMLLPDPPMERSARELSLKAGKFCSIIKNPSLTSSYVLDLLVEHFGKAGEAISNAQPLEVDETPVMVSSYVLDLLADRLAMKGESATNGHPRDTACPAVSPPNGAQKEAQTAQTENFFPMAGTRFPMKSPKRSNCFSSCDRRCPLTSRFFAGMSKNSTPNIIAPRSRPQILRPRRLSFRPESGRVAVANCTRFQSARSSADSAEISAAHF